MSTAAPSPHVRVRHVSLWVLQGLLAALFLFASFAKLTMPAQVLSSQSGLSAGFMRFIAVAEALGALGLILPGAFRIRRGLTPLAAAGLLVIMVGAVVISAARLGAATAILPFVVGLLLLVVLLGRRGWMAVALSGSLCLRPSSPDSGP